MLSTGLALITSANSHLFVGSSLTEANHLAKVSGRYLERPGSLRVSKVLTFFSLYMEILLLIISDGIKEYIFGNAHRGRLNLLTGLFRYGTF